MSVTNQLPPINPDEDTSPNRTIPDVAPPRVPPPSGAYSKHVAGGRVQSKRRPAPPRAPKSPLYLPVWTLGLMLLVVIGLSFAVVLGVWSMGGNAPTATSTPVIRIITAPPELVQAPTLPVLAAPTFISINLNNTAIPSATPSIEFVLAGPTLPTVVLTATPLTIRINSTIVVDGVDDQKLNVRDRAGVIGSTVLFRADEDERFLIVDGPSQADGFTWWRIQDPNNASRGGWAVANYLLVIASGE